MRTKVLLVAAVLAVAAPAAAQEKTVLSVLPEGAQTITNYYKQNLYDPQDKKIGTVEDIIISRDGKIVAIIAGMGGLLGLGDKIIAIDPKRVTLKKTAGKYPYLEVNISKAEIDAARELTYDRATTTWKLKQ